MTQVMMVGVLWLLGATLAYGSARMVVRAQRSASWPRRRPPSPPLRWRQFAAGVGGTRLHPEVRYQYTVAGTPYSANTTSFGGNDAGSLPDAQCVTHHCASRQLVPVHYEPAYSRPTAS